MKADKNYKMSKPTKTYLNSIRDEELKSVHKELFVEAEYYSANVRKKMSVKTIVETEEE
jgi:hypothetical protein